MKFNTKPGTRYIVLAGNRALGTRAGERYTSDGTNLVLETTGKRKKIVGPIDDALATLLFRECETALPFPLLPVAHDGKGRVTVERYDIPSKARAEVLKTLWPFGGSPPGLNEERYDLHAGKKFKVGDFQVVREDEEDYLVSPFYPRGGTVIDWMPADWEEKG